jgi:hypothetical protein
MTRTNARRIRWARAHRSRDLVAKSIKRGLQQAIELCGGDGAALLQLQMRARNDHHPAGRPRKAPLKCRSEVDPICGTTDR